MRRALVLRKETLAALAEDDLRDLAGAGPATMPCVTGPDTCAVSRKVISLCGCFTEYCSIDVC